MNAAVGYVLARMEHRMESAYWYRGKVMVVVVVVGGHYNYPYGACW